MTSSVTRRTHQWWKKTSHSVASVLKILRRWIYSRTFFTRRIFTYCTRCSVCQYALNFFSNYTRGGGQEKIPGKYGRKSAWQKKYTHPPNFFQASDIFPTKFLTPTPFLKGSCNVECPQTPQTTRGILGHSRGVLTNAAVCISGSARGTRIVVISSALH